MLIRGLPRPGDRMGLIWSLLQIDESVVLEYGPSGTTHFSIGTISSLSPIMNNKLFTTHIDEDDVVMGDVKKLEEAILEIDEKYSPKVIFIIGSAITAVIGSDVKGVCSYMKERVNAKLIAFDSGGFKGSFYKGIEDANLALIKNIVDKENEEKDENLYNIIGLNAQDYRANSNILEIQRMMMEAFNLKLNACFIYDTSISKIKDAKKASFSLILSEAGVKIAKKLNIPYIKMNLFGYSEILESLDEISKLINKEVNPKYKAKISKKLSLIGSLRMSMRFTRLTKISVAIISNPDYTKGLTKMLQAINIPVILSLSDEGEEDEKSLRKEVKALNKTLIFADSISLDLANNTNKKVCFSFPHIAKSQIAEHLPLIGERGTDYIVEKINNYIQEV